MNVGKDRSGDPEGGHFTSLEKSWYISAVDGVLALGVVRSGQILGLFRERIE